MRKIWICFTVMIAIILATADMKYKGFVYKLLPASVQSYMDDIFQ